MSTVLIQRMTCWKMSGQRKSVLAWRLLKNGGLIILDDYGWPADYAPEMKPKIAIDAFTRCYRRQIEVVHSGYQVFLRKKGEA